MKSVRVVKREEREATNNLLVPDHTSTPPRITAEMIVKSWITASRERRQAEMKAHLLDVKRPLGKLYLLAVE